MKKRQAAGGLVLGAVLTLVGCAGPRALTNPAVTFPLDVTEAKPAFLFPVNLSHLGATGDPVAIGQAVGAGVAAKLGSAAVSGQALLEQVGDFSYEVADTLQSQAKSGRWELTGAAGPLGDDLVKMMKLVSKKCVDLKLVEQPTPFRYLIAVHSRGKPVGGTRLSVASWGGIYDTETQTITSFTEATEELENQEAALVAALPTTYSAIISKLLAGSASAHR